jgi:hypothetical protein
MNDSIPGSFGEAGPADSVEGTMRRVAGGVSDAVGQARQAAYQAGDGIADLRRVIRGQPLTMGFLAIGIGYLLGHLSSRSIGR